MIDYRCDRCGRVMNQNANAPKYGLAQYDADGSYKELDLCGDCLKDLDAFMKDKHFYKLAEEESDIEKQLRCIEERVKQLQECVIEHNKCILDIRVDINAIKD